MKQKFLKINDVNVPYVIVRGTNSGVFAGFLIKKEGTEVTLDQCVRIWKWDGAASISQLAITGPKLPDNCKFTLNTDEHQILDVIEIIPCTEEAYTQITAVKKWQE